jgi:SET domain-containing protein
VRASHAVAVGPTAGRGRGVFAQRSFAEGEVIEEAPVVVVPASEVARLRETVLSDYYFVWGAHRNEAALALGLCSLCNHAKYPNARFVLKRDLLEIWLLANRIIRPGEEITINYTGVSGGDGVWFRALT